MARTLCQSFSYLYALYVGWSFLFQVSNTDQPPHTSGAVPEHTAQDYVQTHPEYLQ